MARPSKYTFGRVKRILKHIRNGGTKRGACSAAGIDEKTLLNWENGYSRFSDAIKRAEAYALESDLDRLARFVKSGNLKALFYRLNVVHGLAQKTIVEQTGTVKHEHSHEVREAEKELEAMPADRRARIIAAAFPEPGRN